MSKGKAPATRAKPKMKTKVAVPTGFARPTSPLPTALPPSRVHASSYHYPLILDDEGTGKELLKWFEGIEEARNMPWRKKWLDPAELAAREEEFGKLLEKRAYEVWVSEVMLQQTRVSTVIPYFKAWISKWPTVQALAEASHDEVLSVWKGLGYYSRATRLHEGARTVMSNAGSGTCKIPSSVAELQEIPGIGRYTAGAVSSIAFGEAEPVLDGNVARVLSRQLGLYVDAKDKKSTDVLWEVADQLIKSVAELPEKGRSEVPGQWNQALMELGSTVCTPKPKCDECPIRKTCRVYAEGEVLAVKKVTPTAVPDIEDPCALCQQLDTEDLAAAPEEADDEGEESIPEKPAKRRKVNQKPSNTISNYFTSSTTKTKPKIDVKDEENREIEATIPSEKRKATTATSPQAKAIAIYCSLFPKKMPKKKVPEEDAVICIIETRLADGRRKWLIEQRPAKGLLASLWQFPQSTLQDNEHTNATRKAAARKFISSLDIGSANLTDAVHVAELGSLVHVFTHLKLTMHVHHFRYDMDDEVKSILDRVPARKWVETDRMESETLSTGMRRCWDLMRKKG